jgi:hypothetical protein
MSGDHEAVIHIRSELTPSAVKNDGVEEVDAFVALMLRFLELNPDKRPTAAEALAEPVIVNL